MTNLSKICIIILSSVLLLSGCMSSYKQDTLQQADDLLWEDPDSCINYIQHYQYHLSPYEAKRLELIYQHALFKTCQTYENDSILLELALYFDKKSDFRSKGEAMYIMGANYVQKGENLKASEALKETELLFRKTQDVSPILKGMLYYNLGVATERSRFFDIANEYIKTALPFLKESNKALYISTAYQHMGKNTHHMDSAKQFLDSAYHYALLIDNPVYATEIDVIRDLSFPPSNKKDTDALIEKLVYLCDTCRLNQYLAPLAKIYIEQHQFSQADFLLQKLSSDTASDIWYKEQYYALQSKMLMMKGDTNKAYCILQDLHKWQTEEIENSAYASTYIIMQKYEASHEHELRQKESIKKQAAYIYILIIVLLFLSAAGIGTYYYIRTKQNLILHRNILRTQIKTRIDVAKTLHQWASKHSEQLPNILNTLSPQQAANDHQNWKAFYSEFNICYDNILQRLKEQYPELTEGDLQYIAIIYLGFDTTDFAFILGISRRTIWNRRTIIKQHLGLDENQDLDEWIKTQLEA